MTQTNRARRINFLQSTRWMVRQSYISSDMLLSLFASIRNESDFQRQRYWKRVKFLFLFLCLSAQFILLAINTTLHTKSALLTDQWWDVVILIFSFIISLFFFLLPIPFLNGYINLPAKAFVLRTLIKQQELSTTAEDYCTDDHADMPLLITLQVTAAKQQKQSTFSLFDLGILYLSVLFPLFSVIIAIQANPFRLSPSSDNSLYYFTFTSCIIIIASVSIVSFRTIGLTLDTQGIAKRKHVWSTTTYANISWKDAQAFYTATDATLTGKTRVFYLLDCSTTTLLWVINEAKSSEQDMQDSDCLRQLILASTHLKLQDITTELHAVRRASPQETSLTL